MRVGRRRKTVVRVREGRGRMGVGRREV